MSCSTPRHHTRLPRSRDTARQGGGKEGRRSAPCARVKGTIEPNSKRLGRSRQLRIDRRAAREAARYDGKWVLVTNDDSLDAADAAQAYKGLMVIERCFRNLKRVQLQMQPMYHWLERRITAHVKLCVLALLLQRIAELRAGRSWMRIRHILDQVQVTELKAGDDHFLQVNRLSDDAAELLDSLGIKPPKRVLAVFPG